MMCPGCGSKNEMAYSVMAHAFVCLEDGCGFELEMSADEAFAIFAPTKELVCA